MKLTDFIMDIGKPVAYYPGLKKITGSTTATILLCQLIYWIGKGSSKNGEIYKTSSEIEEETGLTYEEQKTARAKLKNLGITKERYARVEHTIYFYVDRDKIDELWASSHCLDAIKNDEASRQSPVREQGNPPFGNKAIPRSLNKDTENTQKNTHREKKSKNIDLNGNPELEDWQVQKLYSVFNYSDKNTANFISLGSKIGAPAQRTLNEKLAKYGFEKVFTIFMWAVNNTKDFPYAIGCVNNKIDTWNFPGEEKKPEPIPHVPHVVDTPLTRHLETFVPRKAVS